MNYKFKPQKAILVAGIMAAAYAEACYQQATSAVCFQAGEAIDTFNWSDVSATHAYALARLVRERPPRRLWLSRV